MNLQPLETLKTRSLTLAAYWLTLGLHDDLETARAEAEATLARFPGRLTPAFLRPISRRMPSQTLVHRCIDADWARLTVSCLGLDRTPAPKEGQP